MRSPLLFGFPVAVVLVSAPGSGRAQAQPAAPDAAPAAVILVEPPPGPDPNLVRREQLDATLQLLLRRGLITQAEYEDARAGRTLPQPASPPPPSTTSGPSGLSLPLPSVLSKWDATLYGFVEADTILDTTQSLGELAGGTVIARPGTYAGDHGRITFTVRNSRLGFRLKAPEFHRVKVSATLEMDFLGNQAPNASELVISTSGLLRLRHVNLQIETPYIDLLIGQSWQLFGWQPYFHPGAVSIPGIAGNVFSRAAQIRLSHRFRTNPVSVDVAVSLARAPQRDSIDPDGQAGLRIVFNNLRGLRTIAATQTSVDSAAIGVSATLRRFSLPEFVQNPQNSVSTAGWGVSVDALFPIIAVPDRRAWALTLHGSFVRGAGIADSFTGLTGGVSFPALPLGGTYNSNIDRGLALFDKNGILGTVDWQAFVVGLQFYLPPQGRIFLISNFSQMNSDNAQNFGEPNQVFTQSRLVNASLFVDATASLRFGIGNGTSLKSGRQRIRAGQCCIDLPIAVRPGQRTSINASATNR